MQEPKSLGNVGPSSAKQNVPDIVVFGDPGVWRCLCKASSKAESWMKSTKVMSLDGLGCLVQVTTQQINPDGSSSLAEALCFVPGACLLTKADGDVTVIVPAPTGRG